MTGQREHRVPVMFSDAELAAIDQMRFDNRIATRSGAIRKLALGNTVDATTIRDKFAMEALRGIIDDCGLSAIEMANRCYEVADAMLIARATERKAQATSARLSDAVLSQGTPDH